MLNNKGHETILSSWRITQIEPAEWVLHCDRGSLCRMQLVVNSCSRWGCWQRNSFRSFFLLLRCVHPLEVMMMMLAVKLNPRTNEATFFFARVPSNCALCVIVVGYSSFRSINCLFESDAAADERHNDGDFRWKLIEWRGPIHENCVVSSMSGFLSPFWG